MADDYLERERRRRDEIDRNRVEAWDHAVAALKEAEKYAARADTSAGAAYAWTGIARAWIELAGQSREGLRDS